MQPVDNDLIQFVTDTIVRHFNPRRIILFGSHARGDSRPDSDLDLIVEMESQKDFYSRTSDVLRVFRLHPWSMDLLVLTPDEMNASREMLGSVVRRAEMEGKVLYERA
jgi:uncharacterized protein